MQATAERCLTLVYFCFEGEKAWGEVALWVEKTEQVSLVLFWPVLCNYTSDHILIGSVFVQNYYQCPSKAVQEIWVREGDMKDGLLVTESGSIYTWMRTAKMPV